MADITSVLSREPFILAEGAVVERLRRQSPHPLDEQVINAGFIYEEAAGKTLEAIYRDYVEIARTHQIPVFIFTPTWRAIRERIEKSPYKGKPLNGDGYRFVDKIRQSYGDYASRIFIGGLMGCKGDAYKPEESLAIGEAREYHREQANALARAGVDFLFASTMPALPEIIGMAHALSLTGKPYILSFMLRRDGRLLDGSSIPAVIREIEENITYPPLGYFANCAHSSFVRKALEALRQESPQYLSKFLGCQPNTSCKSPEDLDNAAELDCESPAAFSEGIANLHWEFNLKVLGGCCGSSPEHIRALADKIKPTTNF
jgi:homocysteine S-methyltransferase